jgi:hypothetical protein
VLQLEADIAVALLELSLVVLRDRLPADQDRPAGRAENAVLCKRGRDSLGTVAAVGFGEPPEDVVDGLPVVARLGARRRDAADYPGGIC